MKNFELLTLSVVAATLVTMTGCSSDDDDSSSASGPSAPSEISTPVELNASAARNAMALIYWDGRIQPAPLRIGIPDNDRNTSQSSTEIRDCDISGTETTTQSEVTTENGDAGWSHTETASVHYDNCIDNSTPPYDTHTRNGRYEETTESSYITETRTRRTREYVLEDYTSALENNNSKVSDIHTYTSHLKETIETRSDNFRENFMHEDGEKKQVITDADGKVTGGERSLYGNIQMTAESVSSTSKKYTVNGFMSQYETNSTGDESIKEGVYFSNYVIHWYKPDRQDNQEEAVTVNGTIGDLCLGGSVTVSTAPVVHSNQYAYFDKDGNNPNPSSKSTTVLPYSGQQQIIGANSATITYDYNTTKRTSATVTIGNETMVYGTWDEFLADNSCGEEK